MKLKLRRMVKWSAALLLLFVVIAHQFRYWTATNDCDAALEGESMKAIKVCKWGGSEALQLREVAKPIPTDSQVQVRVAAASARRRILKPKGICVMVGIGGAGWEPGKGKRILGALSALVRSQFSEEKFVGFIAKTRRDDLAVLRDLMQERKIKPVIDRQYPLPQAAEALAYLEQGRARGKVIVTVADAGGAVLAAAER